MLPMISSWKTVAWEKRDNIKDTIEKIPLRHHTKQRHLQKDEAQLSEGYPMGNRVFRSSHERFIISSLCYYSLLYFCEFGVIRRLH